MSINDEIKKSLLEKIEQKLDSGDYRGGFDNEKQNDSPEFDDGFNAKVIEQSSVESAMSFLRKRSKES